MQRRRILARIVCAAAMITPPIGLAHKGVTNPAVMARMNNMTLLAAELAVVGKMLKGETKFDAQTAHLAVRNIARYGEETTALFEAHETDPKSEAKPEIWHYKPFFVCRANRYYGNCGGEYRNRTGVHGFAIRCVTTPPTRHRVQSC